MKDKNGNEIKVGDVVRHTGVTGEVCEVGPCHYICSSWSDGYWPMTGGNVSCYVEIVKSTEQETFTEQDEKLLQLLTNKKAQALKEKMTAEEDYDDLRKALYENADCINLKEYLAENIDKICDTLQNYKKHCIK